jgi:hypothetical protein
MTEPIDAQISFDDGASFESTQVTALGPDQYRLEATPVFSEAAAFGDIIEATKDAKEQLLFHRLVEKGHFRSYSYLLSLRVVESPEFTALCDEVLHLGGMWEQVFGGWVVLHVPETSDLDVEAAIIHMAATVKNRHPA